MTHVLTLVAAAVLLAQAAVTFEAASIKRSTAGHGNTSRNTGAGGRLVFENFTLHELLAAAYDVTNRQVTGGPPWMMRDRFDVMATAGRPLPLAQLHEMLRGVLAERFRLTMHRETREMPTYVLTRARADGRLGPGLKRSTADCGPTGRGTGPRAPGAAPGLPAGCRAWATPAGIDFAGQPIANLAGILSRYFDRPVVDKTGLEGGYDFTLTFTADGGAGAAAAPPPGSPAAAPPPREANAPSIFTAVQEQLGLTLEAQRERTEVFVVDRAEPPTPD